MRRLTPAPLRPAPIVVPLYRLADLAEDAFSALIEDAAEWQKPALRRILHETADLLSAPEVDELDEL